jgi:hypothetical protein
VSKRNLKNERRKKMTEKERQQFLIGLGIWKLELESEPGRRAKERKFIFGDRARPGRLTGILNRLKRPR